VRAVPVWGPAHFGATIEAHHGVCAGRDVPIEEVGKLDEKDGVEPCFVELPGV